MVSCKRQKRRQPPQESAHYVHSLAPPSHLMRRRVIMMRILIKAILIKAKIYANTTLTKKKDKDIKFIRDKITQKMVRKSCCYRY